MKGNVIQFSDLLSGHNKHFVIPVYQRNYDWSTKQCAQLFDDLISVVNKKQSKHFFGSVVYKPETSSELTIIDGQQRITTVTLLLLAIHNLGKAGKVEINNAHLVDEIFETYLVNKFQTEDQKLKLKPVNDNRVAYSNLFGDEKFYIHGTNITENYQGFCERILKMSCSVDELYSAIQKLQIMEISLNEPDDDPQFIFESLNSTGLDLNEADKVRNYVLMGLPAKLQEKYYDTYWSSIEINTKQEDDLDNSGCSSFIRNYLIIKTNRTPNKSAVYQEFKDFVRRQDNPSIEFILSEMKDYAHYYHLIRTSSTPVEKVNKLLRRFNLMDRDVTMPFFLAVYRDYESKEIVDKDLFDVFKAVDVFIFRRFICGLPTNALNKIFVQLHKDIIRLKGDLDGYTDVVIYLLNNKGGNGKYPDDQEFRDMMKLKDLYNINPNNRVYLFESLEDLDSKDVSAIALGLKSGSLSIEHIMPQTLSKAWQDELGDNWKQIHENYLNRLGNLTVTGYNSEYKNSSFIKKKTNSQGFDHSPYRINNYLKQVNNWSENEISERGDLLISDAVRYWSMRPSSFIPPQTDVDILPMGDVEDFTGRVLKSFEFSGTKENVFSWKEMYVRVLKQLFQLDKALLYQIANDDNYLMPQKKVNKLFENDYDEIAEDLYVYKATSTYAKISSLRRVFGRYDLNTDELIFELQPTKVV